MTAENFDLTKELFSSAQQSFSERLKLFVALRSQSNIWSYAREIVGPQDREVLVKDPFGGGELKRMKMFGSNNYLGLANHKKVKEHIDRVTAQLGTGTGGPPHLNGYSTLIRELEESLAQSRGKEAAMLYSSGFAANYSLATALFSRKTTVIYDEYSHASLYDGILASRCKAKRFAHNDCSDLQKILDNTIDKDNDVFICIEGVYSMDGDLPPLRDMIGIAEQYNAKIIVDDAHGTGVVGRTGKGIGEHFDCDESLDIIMGTFSKAIAASGGYIAADRDVIDYLRWIARPYMFSASMPPVLLASIQGAYKVLEEENYRVSALHANVNSAVAKIRQLKHSIKVNPESAILVIHAPQGMNIEQASRHFHDRGIFLNTIQYPAVPFGMERFRISMSCDHTSNDIDALVDAIDSVWSLYA